MRYRISHSTRFGYSAPVPVCHNQVHLAPRTLGQQRCSSFSLLVNPIPTNRIQRLDYFGNHVDYFTIQSPHHGLNVTAVSNIEVLPKAEVTTEEAPTWDQVVDSLADPPTTACIDAYQFTFSSAHIPLDAEYAEYAAQSFVKGRNIVEAALELTGRIFRDFKYDPRATTVSTPVSEVFGARSGVCQDFAHLEIACLRSLGLPARYVSGYLRTIPPPGKPRLVGADASHAWLSVFCGELGWIDFDPTNNVIPNTDHITLAWGRDYRDVCPIRGVFVGGGDHSLSISVDVAPVEETSVR